MAITIIEAHQQSTIIITGQNTMLMSLVTTVNVLAIFRRNIEPRNEISRVEESLETILTITAIFMAMEKISRIFPILPTQRSQNLHSSHKT